MKKIYIALAVLGTALLSSCVQEKSFNDVKPLGENEIAFVMQNTSTRSAEGSELKSVKGITIPVDISDHGETLFLEETIEELNPAPATKGAPAYTAYLGELYEDLGVYADGGSFGTAVYSKMDESLYENKGWRYQHNYNGRPWPGDDDVNFYLWMPAEGNGVTIKDKANKQIKFELTSPLDGKDQEDILFGQTTENYPHYLNNCLPGGIPVTMQHALTGIKFRNGHENDNQTKTVITRVEIIGLKGFGKGTFNADGTFSWPKTDLSTPSTAAEPFFLDFNDPDYTASAGKNNIDGTISPVAEGGTAGDYNWNSNLGSSWTSAAADHNLNAKDGSLTFWFIPQEVPEDLTLIVYFKVKTPDNPNNSGSDKETVFPHTIALGSILNERYHEKNQDATGNLMWDAGQLRTYTLKPYDVDVEIEDTITATQKSQLHVANTGNVDEYVRMLIVGNWYGWLPNQDMSEEPSILVGYKYKGDETGLTDDQKREMILPWYREGYPCTVEGDASTINVALDGPNYTGPRVDPYGEFDTSFFLAQLGSRDGKRNDWADASGGFYYTMPIGPGEGVGYQEAATKALFNSYTVTNVPTIYVAYDGVKRAAAKGVHLVMEVAVQAIAAEKDTWWLQAWYDATGIKKLNPEYKEEGATDLYNKKYVDFYNNDEYKPSSN